MRILYDGDIYTMQAAGGINRYFANIISRLPESFNPAITTCQPRNLNFPSHPRLQTLLFQRYGFRPRRFSYWLEKHYFRSVERFQNYRLLHPTYYTLLTRQNFSNCRLPIVLTVWDMIYEIFYPEHGMVSCKRDAILAAQKILCISENTKKDLLERYSLPEDRVTVTYLASEIDAKMIDKTTSVPEQPFYLYVGNRTSYKNFDRLLLALSKVVLAYPDLALCVVGSELTEQENRNIADLNLTKHIHHYSHTSDGHLAHLYHQSIAFVYPSLYEGFGIPPLEAMACGTAVIAANTSSLPEVIGDAGILINPESLDELVDSLLVVLNEPGKRDSLISQGYQRAKLFSWDKTTAQTLKVYQSL